MNRYCQSCGMPTKNDPENGGTEADGKKSEHYCSYCYKDGFFTQANFTVTDMQNFCISKMKEMGMPKFLGWIFTRNLPKLKRWQEVKRGLACVTDFKR